jgi:hypothetical protein
MEQISIGGGDRHCRRTIGLTPALDGPDGLRDLGKWFYDHFFWSIADRFFYEE